MHEPKHTPEPWYADDLDGTHLGLWSRVTGALVAQTRRGAHEDSNFDLTGMQTTEEDANAARIVDCVNGCATIPKPEHVGGLVEAAQPVAEWMREVARERMANDRLMRPRWAERLAEADRLLAALAAIRGED